MIKNESLTNKTNYIITRSFGTKSITELISDKMVNLCNSENSLTDTGVCCYNKVESVEEGVDENR